MVQMVSQRFSEVRLNVKNKKLSLKQLQYHLVLNK